MQWFFAFAVLFLPGGSELTTACDYRVVEESATIQSVHAKMGVAPGWGGGARLISIVGYVPSFI